MVVIVLVKTAGNPRFRINRASRWAPAVRPYETENP